MTRLRPLGMPELISIARKYVDKRDDPVLESILGALCVSGVDGTRWQVSLPVDVDDDMVDGRRVLGILGEEEQIAWFELSSWDVNARLRLCGGVASNFHTGFRPGVLGQARAVEALRAGAAADAVAWPVRAASAPGVGHAQHLEGGGQCDTTTAGRP